MISGSSRNTGAFAAGASLLGGGGGGGGAPRPGSFGRMPANDSPTPVIASSSGTAASNTNFFSCPRGGRCCAAVPSTCSAAGLAALLMIHLLVH